jgi:hypothetical protein
VPGFVEIDLVGHEGANSSGQFCFTLTVTDIATGWTVNRSVPNKAQKHVFAALQQAISVFPFPVVGIDSDNGGEFINNNLFDFCQEHRITFTRSRPYNKNDGAHVEQKNWSRVRELVGYLRYDTAAELELLNQIWELDRVFTNYLLPQQKLVSKTRHGAKVTKTHDAPATPHQRAAADPHSQEGGNPHERRLPQSQAGGPVPADPCPHRPTRNPRHRQATSTRQTPSQRGLEPPTQPEVFQ